MLPRDDQRSLFRPRSESVRDVEWTEADVALVDEADALLGPVEAARPRRRGRSGAAKEEVEAAASVVRELGLGGYTTAAALAERYGGAASPGADAIPELRTFGHILVDEAQDLTPMQWRMLARRCPNGSMTIVGDFGQASRPGAASGWDEVLEHLPTHDEPRRVTLTVNYRTPAEIMDLANRLLTAAASGVQPTQSVRRTGLPPRFTRVDDLVAGAADAARVAMDAGGTVAVISPVELHAAITESLADLGAVADAAEALDAPIGVLLPTDAKGLEFDHVIVVEPSRLVTPDSSGLRLLYVTLTRATQTLTVIHADALPEALSRARQREGVTVMTPTETADRTAADVAWDLEPLVDGRGIAGVDAQLEAADALAASLETRRGHVAELDAAGLAALMHETAELAELLGRAGSYAGLRFSVDTSDPELGALMQRVEERSTAISTRVLFFELEWAELSDERVDELLADDQLAFCRHHLRSARRYRPASPLGAGGEDPRREGGHRRECVVASVRRADLHDHDRSRG